MKSCTRSRIPSLTMLAITLIAFTYLRADNLTFPGPSSSLELGRTYRLTWNAAPGSGQKLFLLKGGSRFQDLGVVSTPSNRLGSFDWKTLDAGTDLQIQLLDANDRVLFTSPAFTTSETVSRSIRITEPSKQAGSPPNQEFKIGDRMEVLWDYSGDTGSLDTDPYGSEHQVEVVLACQDRAETRVTAPLGSGGHGRTTITFPQISTPNTTSGQGKPVGKADCSIGIRWVWVPYSLTSYQVTGFSDVRVTVVNPQRFKEEQAEREKAGFISVTSPGAGTVRAGDRVTVSWDHAAWMNSPVNILLQSGYGGPQTKIAQAVPIGSGSKGTYTWNVAAPFPSGEGIYSILVQAANNPAQTGSSPSFDLRCADSAMRITSPTVDDSAFEFTTSRTISWTPASGSSGRYNVALSRSRFGAGSIHWTTSNPSLSFMLQDPDGYRYAARQRNENGLLDLAQGGAFFLRVADAETGCPCAAMPVTLVPAGQVSITKPAAGDRISLAASGPMKFGTLSWNARLHYRTQKAKITLNRGSGSSATEVAVLSAAEPIVTGTYDFRYLMPANVAVGSDYFIKMVITGPTAIPIEVQSPRFSLTNEPQQLIRPGR